MNTHKATCILHTHTTHTPHTHTHTKHVFLKCRGQNHLYVIEWMVHDSISNFLTPSHIQTHTHTHTHTHIHTHTHTQYLDVAARIICTLLYGWYMIQYQ